MQCYRLVTAAFFHGSVLHIAFNALSLHSTGIVLERRMGSSPFLFVNLLLVIAAGVLTFVISVLSAVFGYPDFMGQCAIGYSGVIFALVTMQALINDAEDISWGLRRRWRCDTLQSDGLLLCSRKAVPLCAPRHQPDDAI